MKCQFSEMQFLAEITRELINSKFPHNRGWLCPEIPTQPKEDVLGYDFRIVGPVRTIFFQFKVPQKKTDKRALHWNEMGKRPFFCFDIYPDNKSHQHNLLVDKANENINYKVYYCAPRFYTQRDFEEHYYKEDVYKNSVYVPCKYLKRISGKDEHQICYTENTYEPAIMFSEPHYAKAYDYESFMLDVMESEQYENIIECVRTVSKSFSCEISNIENPLLAYNELATYLQIKENIFMMLYLE